MFVWLEDAQLDGKRVKFLKRQLQSSEVMVETRILNCLTSARFIFSYVLVL